ncbi:protein kinase-like domain, concanavalin A-like lectin/glucanase domain protein [Tanacetum coccineum]|uniref:Protein kinase-like domain, concanavalin A-like lectin/glucanase domain protein n=1 Tax=Tanacetum coccineum TaxID=301880 RepID=A0ABQ5FYM2_9ASTR
MKEKEGEGESRDIKQDDPVNRARGDTKRVDEVDEESEESEKEVKEEEDDPQYFNTFPTIEELGYHEWILKNPRPPWVNAKIMSEGLKSRRKPSNPKKISNFVGRVKGLKVFVGNFTYECDFAVVEDTTSVIDHYLGGMVLGKPFVKESGLVYDKDEGTLTFEKDKERITFKMPRKMERFKHIDKEILKTDNIPPFIITCDDSDQERTHYLDILSLRPAYKRYGNITKAIQCLIKMKSRTSIDEVT